MPLSKALERHAAERPDAPACVIGGSRLSFAQLWARTGEIHSALAALPRRERGSELPQDIPLFALAAGNHPAAAEFLASALARPCCVALLDPAWPSAQLVEIMKRVAPDILVCITDEAEKAAGDIPVLRVDEVGRYRRWLESATAMNGDIIPGDDDPFLIGFTSGTTSVPKAFIRKRGTWRASAQAGRRHFSLGPDSHTLAPGPLAHGLTLYAFMETLEAGATYNGLAKFDALAMRDILSQDRPDRLVCVPTILEALCRVADTDGERLPAPRRITTAGARLGQDLADRLSRSTQAAEVTEYYGASELGFVTTTKYKRDKAGHFVLNAASAGIPFPGVAVSVRENGATLAAGKDGLIHVKSPLVIDGYLFGGDGSGFRREAEWVSVGDIGRLDDEGRLTLLGRSGGMIITAGHNVYPGEIVEVLRQLPDVSEAFVTAAADPYLGQMILAVIELHPGHARTANDIVRNCEKKLPRYKVPRKFFAISEWPMTSSGKIAAGTIKDWIESHDERLQPI